MQKVMWSEGDGYGVARSVPSHYPFTTRSYAIVSPLISRFLGGIGLVAASFWLVSDYTGVIPWDASSIEVGALLAIWFLCLVPFVPRTRSFRIRSFTRRAVAGRARVLILLAMLTGALYLFLGVFAASVGLVLGVLALAKAYVVSEDPMASEVATTPLVAPWMIICIAATAVVLPAYIPAAIAVLLVMLHVVWAPMTTPETTPQERRDALVSMYAAGNVAVGAIIAVPVFVASRFMIGILPEARSLLAVAAGYGLLLLGPILLVVSGWSLSTGRSWSRPIAMLAGTATLLLASAYGYLSFLPYSDLARGCWVPFSPGFLTSFALFLPTALGAAYAILMTSFVARTPIRPRPERLQ